LLVPRGPACHLRREQMTNPMTDLARIIHIFEDTTVRLNVEENQLVKVFGEFCVCIGSLKSA
jgi:hypothetical protein